MPGRGSTRPYKFFLFVRAGVPRPLVTLSTRPSFPAETFERRFKLLVASRAATLRFVGRAAHPASPGIPPCDALRCRAPPPRAPPDPPGAKFNSAQNVQSGACHAFI